MAVNYRGRQLAQRVGLAVPVYHKKEGATPHPGVCVHSLQYEGRPDGHFGVRVGILVVWVEGVEKFVKN